MSHPKLSSPAEVHERAAFMHFNDAVHVIEAYLKKPRPPLHDSTGTYYAVDAAQLMYLADAERRQVCVAYEATGWLKVEFEPQEDIKLYFKLTRVSA